MPLILKGVQCWEDALQAYDLGLAGVVLSNHGGRQLDFARSGLEILVEVVEKLGEKRGLKFPNGRFELYVDGGVRRATDVIKAVALGATAGESESECWVSYIRTRADELWYRYRRNLNSGRRTAVLVRVFDVWGGWGG